MKKTAFFVAVILSLVSVNVFATSEKVEISNTKKEAIVRNCDSIMEQLKALQRTDSRSRYYLGHYYETVLSKYITPLNLRLTERFLSSNSFVENQNSYNKALASFRIEYVEAQKALEDLVATNCKTEPETFYEKLVTARAKRKIVSDSVTYMRKLSDDHIKLVKELREKQQ